MNDFAALIGVLGPMYAIVRVTRLIRSIFGSSS